LRRSQEEDWKSHEFFSSFFFLFSSSFIYLFATNSNLNFIQIRVEKRAEIKESEKVQKKDIKQKKK